MLIVTRFQLCVYSTVDRIKIVWYNLLFFLLLFQFWFFLEVYFVIDKLSKELEQTDPYYVNRLMTKGVITHINCNPCGELKIVLLLCSEVLLRVSSDVSLQYFTTSTFQGSFSSPRSKFTRHSLRN